MLKNVEKFFKIIENNCTNLINKEELIGKIKENRPLKIKLGADPSAPDLHLGHYVVLKQLKAMQALGHEIIFLIGDFTGMIGDPTNKNKARKALTREEVLENAETYKKQIFKVLDESKTTIKFNSQWHLNMPFQKILSITSRYTLARILERNDFAKRFKNDNPITITELLYPLIQGYDSVALEADIEVGGSDQLFNLLVGRNLQKEFQQQPQVVLTFPILEGLDGGKKMSKSLGNYVGLMEEPKEMFGKIMSIPDALIFKYLSLLTDWGEEKIEVERKKNQAGKNPRDLKLNLASEVVEIFYNQKTALKERNNFLSIFSKKEIPQDIPFIEIDNPKIKVLDLLKKTKLFKSNGEIRRIVNGGGVRINQKKVESDLQLISLTKKSIIKVGKKDFFRVELN